MFIKTIKNLALAVTAMTALSAQAATVTIDGTISGCTGLCLVFSAPGNSVSATFDDTGAGSPSLEIQGNLGNVVLFNNQMIAPDVTTFPAAFGPLAGIPTPKILGVDISTDYVNQVTVFGTGATTSAPVWGIFDLVNNTFESYLFTPDQGDGTPAVLFLSDGTFTSTAVPVPAAAWFMVSGLVGLFGMKRAQAKK